MKWLKNSSCLEISHAPVCCEELIECDERVVLLSCPRTSVREVIVSWNMPLFVSNASDFGANCVLHKNATMKK